MLSKDHAPLLYSLLFGEGVVNDATAIVLLGASQARHLPRPRALCRIPAPACKPNGPQPLCLALMAGCLLLVRPRGAQ